MALIAYKSTIEINNYTYILHLGIHKTYIAKYTIKS